MSQVNFQSTKRKTKIVCTMGPSVDRGDNMRQLILAGMDVARFNFSHDTHENHLLRFEKLQKLRTELGVPIATMLDTRGPEIRLGTFEKGSITLEQGQEFTLTTQDIIGNQHQVSITYKQLPEDVQVGGAILIDDGLVELKITKVSPSEITCLAINGGVLSDRKGVNVPNVQLSMPFISEKDKEDIRFGLQQGFDFVAASFVRTAADIMQIRDIMKEANMGSMNIIAKIENMQGVQNIDDIIRVADGIMIARGDMGVEIPLEDVPVYQKLIIRKVYRAGKQVITATQLLDSMMKNPRPTRAEATDVATAIYDGTSAIMLSGETAAGKYPVESVKTMARIALRTEADIDYMQIFRSRESRPSTDITSAISHATCTSAHDLSAAAIITVTKSGKTARMISKYRPQCPIIGCTTSPQVQRQLNMSWGVTPLLIGEESNTDELFEHAVEAGEKAGLLKSGELVVLTTGVPLGISGTTNLMKVHIVGHILVSGKGISGKFACASLCVAHSEAAALSHFKDGDILVIHQTNNRLLPLIQKASALILEDDDINGHGAVAGMSLGIPVLIAASQATQILKSGSVVSVDVASGTVSSNPNAEDLCGPA
ncbi:MAG: pyruvate kinase [Clostridiales bacterium]|nr:pyruvate kinase [Clostridiales bacterium]